MASACVNNMGDNFTSFPSYGWLSPRISISRDDDSSPNSKSPGLKPKPPSPEKSDPNNNSVNDFEFRLEDPVTMLPADELFSNGKLMPLQISSLFPPPESPKSIGSNDISPKAPRCSSRWKELLGLKRLYHKQEEEEEEEEEEGNSNIHIRRHKSLFTNTKSLRNIAHRSSKSQDSSLTLPLLFEKNGLNSLSLSSSRLSLSSSSAGHDEIDLPRLSLDTTDKPSSFQLQKNSLNFSHNPARIRLVNTSTSHSSNNNNYNNLTGRGISVDSPRMNSSGKIVFHGLERSSSSPSSLNGGVRHKLRGMERSYSANVRVTPVLNVPVCSKSGGVFGFPFFSAPPLKRNAKTQQHTSTKTKTDRV